MQTSTVELDGKPITFTPVKTEHLLSYWTLPISAGTEPMKLSMRY